MSHHSKKTQNRKRRNNTGSRSRKQRTTNSYSNCKPSNEMNSHDKYILVGALGAAINTKFGPEALETNLNFIRTQRVGQNNYIAAYCDEFDGKEMGIIQGGDCSFVGVDMFQVFISMPSPKTGKGGFFLVGTYSGKATEDIRDKWLEDGAMKVVLGVLLENEEFFTPVVQFATLNLELQRSINEFEQTMN